MGSSSKINPSTKGAIYMVPRANLGGDSISFLHLGPLGWGILPLTRACTHNAPKI